jgi:hypothetical protein
LRGGEATMVTVRRKSAVNAEIKIDHSRPRHWPNFPLCVSQLLEGKLRLYFAEYMLYYE